MLSVLAGAVCISFAAILVKGVSLGPSAVVVWRMGVAALALLLLSRGWRRSRRGATWAVVAGLCFAADLLCWHRSIRMAGAGPATLLANTQVFWVTLLSAVFLGERLRLRMVAAAVVAVLGLVLLSRPELQTDPAYLEGVAWGAVSGLAYGLYYLALLQSRRVEDALPMIPNLAVASGVTAMAAIPMAAGEGVMPASALELGLLVALGLGVHVGGWLFISRGMDQLPAGSGSLLLLLQPTLATLWGVLIFHEPLDLVGAVGVGLVLGAVGVASR